MNLNVTYIQPFLWLWIVVFANGYKPVDDGYIELCDPKKGYRCECPSFGDNKKSIDCSNRDLKNMSQFIQFPDSVLTVNFNNNKIKAILQNSFVEGRNVIEFDISHNSIDFIQHSVFQPFNSLQNLILSHNSIWSLDSNLFDGLQSLKTLDLSYNRIQSWDKNIFIPCIDLKDLNLRYNSIGSTGLAFEAFQHLPHIEKLNLENTGLTELPFNIFVSNYKLKFLYLNGNPFKTVPNSALQSAPSLKFVDMSATNLQFIQYEDFIGLKSLTELRLERIPSLKRIEMNSFSDLESLQTFVCRHNYQLIEINSKAFTNNITGEPLHHLSDIILRHNSLQTLSPEMVLWKALQHMDLEGNPWNCNCDLKWMAEIDIKNLLLDTKCHEPHRLSGQVIKSLSGSDFVCQSLLIGDSFLITLLIFMIFATVGLMGIAFLFIRNQWCSNGCYIPFRREKLNYVNVIANKERLDLEWDDSAEP